MLVGQALSIDAAIRMAMGRFLSEHGNRGKAEDKRLKRLLKVYLVGFFFLKKVSTRRRDVPPYIR